MQQPYKMYHPTSTAQGFYPKYVKLSQTSMSGRGQTPQPQSQVSERVYNSAGKF